MNEYISKSTAETEEIAEKIVKVLKKGEILGLIGELGAGKTCFIHGLAKGLNVAKNCYVSSPTFTILKVYPADRDIYHFDFYRLEKDYEFEDLGFDDYLKGDGLVVIEWADKFINLLPKDIIKIIFEVVNENERKITLPEEIAGRLKGGLKI